MLVLVSCACCLQNASGQDFLNRLEDKLKKLAPSETPPSKEPASEEDGESLPAPKPGSDEGAPAKKEGNATNPFMLEGESENTKVPNGKLPPPSRPMPDRPVPNQGVSPKLKPRPGINGAAPSIELGPEQGVGPSDSNEPGYLGLVAERVPGGGLGLLVVEVTDNSPAWKAGFQRGDRILAVGGNAISTLDDLASQLGTYRAGSAVRFLISRNGRNKDINAVLMNRAVASRTQVDPNLAAGNGSYVPIGPSVNPASAGMVIADLSEYFRRQFGIPAYRGAAVVEVVSGSPADISGLKPGDCIIEVDQRVVQRASDIQEWARSAVAGQTSTIAYYRGRTLNQVQLVFGVSDVMQDQAIQGAMDPNAISPEYVSSLQQELDRVRQQLSQTQNRLQELEQRMRTVEANRPRR